MKTKVQKGLTLVELIIASVAGVIVILAAGTVLVSVHRFWYTAWERVNLQRDASYAMLRIGRSVRAGISAELENDGKAIKIHREANWIKFFLDEGSNDLKCEVEGVGIHTIIDDNVEDLVFTVEADKINIDLKLKKDNLQNHFTSSVTIRNYGG